VAQSTALPPPDAPADTESNHSNESRTRPARLWLQQGKRIEARDLLAPVYGWFTLGYDTADLQAAQALPAELS
jgi:predicted ATPase